jgi:CRISPR system Cascade subunit CasB
MTDREIGYRIFEWWKDLWGFKIDEENSQKKVDAGRSGERAELRRCAEPQQVLMCKGFHRLKLQFKETDFKFDYQESLAAIAGLCSHIKNSESNLSFPALLATPEKDKTSPPLSEQRFQKLVTSRTPEDFYTNLRRSIQIVKNKGNIYSITDGVFTWYKNLKNPSANVRDTLLFQWSNDYFDIILKKETKTTK